MAMKGTFYSTDFNVSYCLHVAACHHYLSAFLVVYPVYIMKVLMVILCVKIRSNTHNGNCTVS